MLKDIRAADQYREICPMCSRRTSLCLCAHITPFDIEPLIVLLAHPKEYRNSVGTLRIIKLSIPESILIIDDGHGFDEHPRFNDLIQNPNHHCRVLFPGSDSLNISTNDSSILNEAIPKDKRLVIFVIDGTWTSAKQMIRRSLKLSTLPKISFNVETHSIYQFRKQPKEFCLSSLEAVGVLISHLKSKGLCNPKPAGAETQILNGFKELIRSQLEFEKRRELREKNFKKI